MSTIERAAARLGTIGKVRSEPFFRDPAPIVEPAATDISSADADVSGDEDALPAFLAGDEDDAGEDETDKPAVIAAE